MTALLEAKALGKTYTRPALIRRQAPRQVLDRIDLAIAPGESLAILGRSGSGKSTLIRQLLGLERPSAGTVCFQGRDLRQFSATEWKTFRRATQLVFQDSISAVNPRHRIGWIIAEPLRHLTALDDTARNAKVADLLVSVGLRVEDAGKLPSQMSGGQLQRVCIARALATDPQLLVLDEAVSNLDILVQGQIVDLIRAMRARYGMAVTFITHDLRLVNLVCERVVVLEQGRIVETCAVGAHLHLTSPEGRALQQAVLPAMPRIAADPGRIMLADQTPPVWPSRGVE
jgi:nickel transport system ATP-binding protein